MGAVAVSACVVVTACGSSKKPSMQVALKQANSSGELHGEKIVLTVKDTASEQTNATTLMSQAVRTNAVAIFGPALINEALATAPIAESAKVVDIATLSEVNGLLNAGPYIYRLTPSELRYDPLIACRSTSASTAALRGGLSRPGRRRGPRAGVRRRRAGDGGPVVSSDADLRISDLIVRYGHLTAVDGISFEVPAGVIVAVLGANRAGQSSTLRAVAGGLKAHVSGEVELFGERVARRASYRMVARGMVLVPEWRQVIAPHTVEENLLLGGHRQRSRQIQRATLEQVYELFPVLQERPRGGAGGDDAGTNLGVLVAARKRRRKLGKERVVHRVALVRAVHGDPGDALGGPVDGQRLEVGHGAGSLRGPGR